MAISLCKDPECYNYGRYCRLHATGKQDAAKKSNEQEQKARKGIAPKSEKRTELDKEYAAVSKPLWQGKPCAVKLPGCTGKAQGMHHLEGKENAEKLLNMEECIPSCNMCNLAIEADHSGSVAAGLKKKKNTATKRYDNSFKKK